MRIKGSRLGEFRGRSYNLQFIRFIAAILVIMSHAFGLTQGDLRNDYIYKITNGQTNMGQTAVCIFFLVGGYLIAKSIFRLKTFKHYFVARCLRIFPLLITVVLLCMFLVGPIFTTYSLNDYFSDTRFYKYALNGLLFLQHDLPGLFEHNIYDSAVNGALWTLPVEFLCYIMCYILYRLNLLDIKKVGFTIPAAIVGSIGIIYIANVMNLDIIKAVLLPGLLFYIGILFYVYRDKIILNRWLAIGFTLLLMLSSLLGFLQIGILLFFPYVFMCICFGEKQAFKKSSALGNLSYAIYLCAFPIQQVLVQNFEDMQPHTNMLIAFIIVILCSIPLYYLVERPCQKIEIK